LAVLLLEPVREDPVAELTDRLEAQEHQTAAVLLGGDRAEASPQGLDPDLVESFAVAPAEFVRVADLRLAPWWFRPDEEGPLASAFAPRRRRAAPHGPTLPM
jgi:hypothetical protein